jgi:hypothetical protein
MSAIVLKNLAKGQVVFLKASATAGFLDWEKHSRGENHAPHHS